MSDPAKRGLSPSDARSGFVDYFPPPWPLTEENEEKTKGWCAFQDYYYKNQWVSNRMLANQAFILRD
jgi:hypothetical protein